MKLKLEIIKVKRGYTRHILLVEEIGVPSFIERLVSNPYADIYYVVLPFYRGSYKIAEAKYYPQGEYLDEKRKKSLMMALTSTERGVM